jgi:site-specific recombinase XerD
VLERNLNPDFILDSSRGLTRQRDALLARFLLNSGLRMSELLSLRLGDLRLAERLLQVTGRRERHVRLNPEARLALQTWLGLRPETKNPYIWITVAGNECRALSPRGAQRILERLAEQSGLDILTTHTCRYTYAINEIERGVSLEEIANNLGHADVAWLYRVLWLSRHGQIY